jgi:putative cell wall-binding protein
VVGGPAAVDEAVVADLRARGLTVERVAGPDRYATAAAVARLFPATFVGALPGGAGRTAIVASGANFADALAGGPLSARASFPILLTAPDALVAPTSEALDALAIRQVLLLGGPQAVSPAVQAAIEAKGIAVRRVGGANRQETAALLADLAVDTLGWPATHANLARGDHFADALAGGWHAGVERAPILLSVDPATLGSPADTWLRARSATVATVDLLGGTAAISDAVAAAAEAAARNA